MPKIPNAILIVCLAAIGALAIWGSFWADRPVRQAIVAAQGKTWKKSAGHKFHAMVRVYGDWPVVLAVAAGALALARWRNNRRWTHILFAAVASAAIAGTVAHVSKLTTGRTRPRESPKIEQGFYGLWKDGQLTVGNSALNSFPSGHTATVFGLAIAIALYSLPWGIPVLLFASVVAWSSVVIGAHHPSDIVVAVVLAGVVAWFVRRWMERGGDAKVDRWFRFHRGEENGDENP